MNFLKRLLGFSSVSERQVPANQLIKECGVVGALQSIGQQGVSGLRVDQEAVAFERELRGFDQRRQGLAPTVQLISKGVETTRGSLSLRRMSLRRCC